MDTETVIYNGMLLSSIKEKITNTCNMYETKKLKDAFHKKKCLVFDSTYMKF